MGRGLSAYEGIEMKFIQLSAALLAFGACSHSDVGESPGSVDLQASCEALIVAETGVRPSEVTALSTRSEATGTVTTVSVAGAATPWLCRADISGVILGAEPGQDV